MKTLSCHEVYERMDNGLCLFCEELDSPGHYHLKHKRVQIFMTVGEDDQLSDDNKLDPVDLKQGEYQAKTIPEEKLNPPPRQNIEHLESKLAQMDSEKSVSHDLIPHARVHGSSPVSPIILSMPSVSPQPPDPPDQNRSNLISAIKVEHGSEPDKENDDPNPDYGDEFMQDAIPFEEDVVNLRFETEEESVIAEKAYDGLAKQAMDNVADKVTVVTDDYEDTVFFEDNIKLYDHVDSALRSNLINKLVVNPVFYIVVELSFPHLYPRSNRSVWEPGGLSSKMEPEKSITTGDMLEIASRIHRMGLQHNTNAGSIPQNLGFDIYSRGLNLWISQSPSQTLGDYKTPYQFWYELDTNGFNVLAAHEEKMLGVLTSCEMVENFEKLTKSWRFKFKGKFEKSLLTGDKLMFTEESRKGFIEEEGYSKPQRLVNINLVKSEQWQLELSTGPRSQILQNDEANLHSHDLLEAMLLRVLCLEKQKKFHKTWKFKYKPDFSLRFLLNAELNEHESLLEEPCEILTEHDKWKRLELFVWLVYGIMLLDTGQEMRSGLVFREEKNSLKNYEPGNKKEKDTLSEDVMLLVFLSLRKSCFLQGEGMHDVHILLLMKDLPKESPMSVSDSDNQEESLLSDKLIGENSHITRQFLKSELRLINGSFLRSPNALSEAGFCYRSYFGFNFTIGVFNSGSLMPSVSVSRFIHTLLVISKTGACSSLLNIEAYMSPRQLQNKKSSVLVGLKDDQTMLVILKPDMVVSYLLKVHHKQAEKVGKQKYNFIEKVVKSIIFAATDEYKDIEADRALLGMGLNGDAHKVSYLVNGYEDEDVMKLSAASFPSTTLKFLYGSLPRPPDFRTIKKSRERLSLHKKDHKLLFPKNLKPLHLRARFWTLFNDVEQLSTELQNSPGLNYFTHLVFLWNQASNCVCIAGHISSGIFSVDGVNEFDTCSKMKIGNETHGKRLLVLAELFMLGIANEADLVVKKNWFHSNPTIEELFHLQRPPELLAGKACISSLRTRYTRVYVHQASKISSLRTRMFSREK